MPKEMEVRVVSINDNFVSMTPGGYAKIKTREVIQQYIDGEWIDTPTYHYHKENKIENTDTK